MNWSSKWDVGDLIPWYDPDKPNYNNSDKTTLFFQDGNKRRSIDVIIIGDLALD